MPSELRLNESIGTAARRTGVPVGAVVLAGLPYHRVPDPGRVSTNAGRKLNYEHLLRRVWRLEGDADLSPMRTAISGLRRRLGDDAEDPAYIFTELRVGYGMPEGETEEG